MRGGDLHKGHYLILGGARSGKSALAEKLALRLGSNPAYIATATAEDDEMRRRILRHQQQRQEKFTTIEEPLALCQVIEETAKSHDAILVDCLTLWLSNIGFDHGCDQNIRIANFLTVLKTVRSSQIILVSNEVGMGIVPDNALARNFRDDAGILHQQVADICDHVSLVVAGLPMLLKGKLPEPGQ